MRRLWILLLLPAVAQAAFPPGWLRLPRPDDPRPVDASAWVLEDSTRVVQQADGTVHRRYRYAVMPLSDAGVRALGCNRVFSAGWEELTSAHAWVMSPDGRKCRAFGIDEFEVSSFMTQNQVWDQEKIVQFGLRKYMRGGEAFAWTIQPGWILAWEVEIRSEQSPFDIEWSPRGAWPVRFASLEIAPPPGGTVTWRGFSRDVPAPTLGASGARVWTLSQLAGIGQDCPENLQTTSLEVRARIELPDAAPAAASWADIVRIARDQMDPQARTSPELLTQVLSLHGSGDLWTRIAPLCRFVQKQITYLEVSIDADSMAGYRPHRAPEVLANRYGDCKDKAVLLCTMLRTIGVEARVALVNSGDPRANRPDWPSAQFNHAIVAIAAAEAPPVGWPVVRAGQTDYVLFDPTADWVPLGLLPSEDVGGETLILGDGVAATVPIPDGPYSTLIFSRRMGIRLSPDGSASVDFSDQRGGLAAADSVYRDESEPRADRTSRLERLIQSWSPLVADLTWDSSSEPSGREWHSQGHFAARYVLKPGAGGAAYLMTDLLSSVPTCEAWEAEPEGWVRFTPQNSHREFQVTPPIGWQIAETPPDWSVSTSAGVGALHYALRQGVLTGAVDLRITGGVVDRPAYLALRDLLRAATAAERRPLVLRKIPAPAKTAVGDASTRPAA